MSSFDITKSVRDFVDAIQDGDKRKSAYDTQATVLRTDGDTVWVHIPGGVDETPVKRTINAEAGDTVQIRVAKGKAWITGNTTNPPTDNQLADRALELAKPGYALATALKDSDISVNSIRASVGYIDDLYSKNIYTENLQATNAYIQHLTAEDITANDIVADHATIGSLDANYAKIDAANITDLTAQNAWVNKIMVETGLIAHESNIFTLDAIQVNAANITAGTIDVNRLIVTVNDQKYLVNINPSTGTPTYEKLDGNIVEPRTITADKIVAHDITVQEITTENLVGTNGWINLNQGKFFYGNGASYAAATNAIEWNGTTLRIKGDIGDSVVFNNYSTTQEMNAAIGDAVDGIEVGGRNLLLNSKLRKSGSENGITFASSTYGEEYTHIYGTATATGNQWVADLRSITITNATVTISANAIPSSSGSPYFYVSTTKNDAWYKDYNKITWYSNTERRLTITLENGETLRYLRLSWNSGESMDNHFKFKVEVGNRQTDWTPAPEDVQAEIDAKKSVHTLMSSSNGSTYANILAWTAEGITDSWSINTSATPLTNVKIGDTCRVAYKVTDMNNAYVYIVGEVTDIYSASIGMKMHGLDTTIIDGGNILTNSIGANQIQANSIGAKHLTISDSTNLATANEMYESSLPILADAEPAISDGYLVKKTETQQYLDVCNHTANSFKQNDELYYEFYGKAATAGSVYLNAWHYTGTPPTHTYVSVNRVSISLTTTETRYSGYIRLGEASWNTATQYLLGFSDLRDTKSQIYIRKLIIRRKSAGELIVDGSITADKIQIGAVDVGGRNLLAGTQYMYNGTGSYTEKTFKADAHGTLSHYTSLTIPHNKLTGAIRVTNSESSTYQCGFFQTAVPIYVQSGTQFTVSFWIRASVADLGIRSYALWYNGSGQGTGTTSGTTTTGWQKIVHTTTVTSDILGTATAGLVYVTNLPTNAWFEVAGLKVEIGNTATDWSDDIPVEGTNYFGTGDCATSVDGLSQSTNTFAITTKDGYKCAHITGALATTGYLGSSHYYVPQKYQFVSMSCDMRLDNYVAGTTNPYICFYYGGATASDASSWFGPKFVNQTFNGEKKYIENGNIATYINNKGWVHVESTSVWYHTYASTTTIPAGYIYARDFTGDLYVRNVKFEFGHKCTPWSAYPLNGKTVDAAKTANNYISASSSGIRIASATPGTQNQRLELTNSDAIFYTSDNVQRLKLNSGSGVIVGREDKGHTVVTDQGMTIYDVNKAKAAETTTNGLVLYKAGSKRAAVTANGLDIFGSDGSTSIASFGATARIGTASGQHINVTGSAVDVYSGTESDATKQASFGATSFIGDLKLTQNGMSYLFTDTSDNNKKWYCGFQALANGSATGRAAFYAGGHTTDNIYSNSEFCVSHSGIVQCTELKYGAAGGTYVSATNRTNVSPTITKSSGSSTLTIASCARVGRVVQLVCTAKTTASISAGSNIFVGTMTTTAYRPAALSFGCGYYGSAVIVAQLETNGTLTVRANSASVASGANVNFSITYLLA